MAQFDHDPVEKRSLIAVKMLEDGQEIIRVYVKGAPEKVIPNCT
jgi:magnesium-transporting ATPase (P-type)